MQPINVPTAEVHLFVCGKSYFLGNDELILLLQNVDHDGLLQAVLDAYEAHTLAMLKIRDLLMIMDSKRDSTRQPLLNLGTTLFNEKVVQVSALPGLQAHRSTS